MQVTEVLEQANITHDSKARRVLNTAPDTIADITIDEIEKGITIERLETLNVPVYQYGGQITIHGIFKDISQNLRVACYKSILPNGNKSLGVKYVAIDADKKQLLLDVARYSKDGYKWYIDKNSSGYSATRVFHSANHEDDKKRLIECYNSTPDNLYIGAKQAVSLMYGGYAVIIGIGAIYKDNLWPLITALTGVISEVEYKQLELQKELDWQNTIKQRVLESEQKRLADQNKLAEAIKTFKPPNNFKPFSGKVDKPGIYAKVTIDHDYTNNIDVTQLRVLQVVKRGRFLCCNSRNFSNMQYEHWQPNEYKARDISFNSGNGWIVSELTEVKTNVNIDVKPDATPKINATTNNNPVLAQSNNITITHNEKLNGIELHFASKPEQTIIDIIKSNGWRWSNKNMLWYNTYNANNMKFVSNLIS
jgi:hypothetical protein